MAIKYVIIGLTVASVAFTTLATVEKGALSEHPIANEADKQSISPGEHMITSVFENHPITLAIDWMSE